MSDHDLQPHDDLEPNAVWERCLSGGDVDRLIAGVRGGDRAALSILVERLGPWLRRVAGARWRLVDPASDVDDICQTAFRRLCGKHEQLNRETEQGLRAWFRKLIENAIYDVARRAATAKRNRRDKVIVALSELVAPTRPSPASALVHDGQLAALREALGHLETVERTILDLFYAEGLALREIAMRVGLTEGAVNKRLQRVRKKLQTLLGRDPRVGRDSRAR
ncbi:MAG: sigma-70 family RNA polymerase sigma factor [Planctomycetes bacterium]|nr:sigma-70 family RNA polymerase sigma factor [Planctomycetota bacterium]